MDNLRFSNDRNSKPLVRTFGIFAITLVLAVSATWWFTRSYFNNNEAVNRTFLRLDSSLGNCNQVLKNSISERANEMSNKLKDVYTVQKAMIWKPKLDSVISYSNAVQSYIQLLRDQLNERVDSHSENSKDKTFHTIEISENLFDSLQRFRLSLINLIPKDQQMKLSILPVQKLLRGSDEQPKQRRVSDYFQALSREAKIALVSKIESDILLSVDIVTDYINNQVVSSANILKHYYPFATQNTCCLLPGQTLEVTAGIGCFSTESNPVIVIDNKEIALNEDGNSIYKKRITVGKGGYVPVSITYKDPNTGEIRSVTKNINYKVFQPPKKQTVIEE